MEPVVIEHGGLKAAVNPINGQLVSLTHEDVEFFHDGGRPGYVGNGWGSSEIVCFPVFGPVKDSRVQVEGLTFPMGPHGIARYTSDNPFLVEEANGDSVALVQRYRSGNVPNPRFALGADNTEFFRWMPYTLTKKLCVGDEGLDCNLSVTNDHPMRIMPYMIGWHPAFVAPKDISCGEFLDGTGRVVANLEEVMRAKMVNGTRTRLVRGSEVIYRDNQSGNCLRVGGTGFGETLLLWSPGPDAGMFCIEPLTQVPDVQNPQYFGDLRRFETLVPGESKEYSIRVEPSLR